MHAATMPTAEERNILRVTEENKDYNPYLASRLAR